MKGWRWIREVVCLLPISELFQPVAAAFHCFAALVTSEVVPQVLLGLELRGPTYALVGMIRAVLGLAAVAIALRIVHFRLRDVGLVSVQWRKDVLIGTAVAVVFAFVHFVGEAIYVGGLAIFEWRHRDLLLTAA